MRKQHASAIALVVTAALLALRLLLPKDTFEATLAHDGEALTTPSAASATQSVDGGIAGEQSIPTIAGVVHTGTGLPLRGARVTLERERVELDSITDDRGQFKFSAPRGSFTLSASAKGFGMARIQTVAPTTDIALTLYPGNRISGRVLMEGSLHPAANARVEALSSSNSLLARADEAMTTTDASGRFELDSLPSGVWTLTASGDGFWGKGRESITVEIGELVDDVTVMVVPAADVSGRFVTGARKLPCPSGVLEIVPEARVQRVIHNKAKLFDGEIVTVEADEREQRFSAQVANGAVRVDSVPYGVYRFSARCDDFQWSGGPKTLNIDGTQQSDLTWEFADASALTVRVMDSADAPLRGISVRIALFPPKQTDLQVLPIRTAVTDANGEVRIGALRPGKYRIDAAFAATKGEHSVVETFDLLPEDAAPQIVLRLPNSGSIRIHSSTGSGGDSSRMLYFATNTDGDRYDAVYGGAGQFSIGPLPSGPYLVYAYDNKNAKVLLNGGTPISVAGGRETTVDFSHDAPTAALRGRVVDASGMPIAGAFVRAVSTTLEEEDELFSVIQLRMHGGQELMTDELGQFTILGLDGRAQYDVYVDRLKGERSVERNIGTNQFLQVVLSHTTSSSMPLGTE